LQSIFVFFVEREQQKKTNIEVYFYLIHEKNNEKWEIQVIVCVCILFRVDLIQIKYKIVVVSFWIFQFMKIYKNMKYLFRLCNNCFSIFFPSYILSYFISFREGALYYFSLKTLFLTFRKTTHKKLKLPISVSFVFKSISVQLFPKI
jgi:hypothetical protein